MDDFQRGFSRAPLTYPAAVYGIREWMLGEGGTPQGMAKHYWAFPEKLATCQAPGTTWNPVGGRVGRLGCAQADVPNMTCTCGIYAYFNATAVRRWGLHMMSSTVVAGVIEGTGKTIIGEHGFKTAHAKVMALSLTNDPWELTIQRVFGLDDAVIAKPLAADVPAVTALAERWQVPMFHSQEHMLQQFPLTVPSRDFPTLSIPGGTSDDRRR